MLAECGHPCSFPNTVLCGVCTWARVRNRIGPYAKYIPKKSRGKGRGRLKKPILPLPGDVISQRALDTDFQSLFPDLWEALSMRREADGTQRETHTLFVCTDGSDWKFLLKDRSEDVQAWFTAVTFNDGLRMCQIACATGKADWRPCGPPGGSRKGKKRG